MTSSFDAPSIINRGFGPVIFFHRQSIITPSHITTADGGGGGGFCLRMRIRLFVTVPELYLIVVFGSLGFGALGLRGFGSRNHLVTVWK